MHNSTIVDLEIAYSNNHHHPGDIRHFSRWGPVFITRRGCSCSGASLPSLSRVQVSSRQSVRSSGGNSLNCSEVVMGSSHAEKELV